MYPLSGADQLQGRTLVASAVGQQWWRPLPSSFPLPMPTLEALHSSLGAVQRPSFPVWTLGLCLPPAPYLSLSQGRLPMEPGCSLASRVFRPASDTKGQGSCLGTMLSTVLVAASGCRLTQTLGICLPHGCPISSVTWFLFSPSLAGCLPAPSGPHLLSRTWSPAQAPVECAERESPRRACQAKGCASAHRAGREGWA